MVSTKVQYNKIIEDLECSNDEKITLLNDLIDNCPIKDVIKYRTKRAIILFHMENWNNALNDIDFIENHGTIDDSLLVIKWKSTIYQKNKEIHDSMKATLGVKILDNTDLIHLSTCLSSENIMQYFQKKGQRKNQGIKKLKK